MSLVFRPVGSDSDIEELAALADEIWHEYWPARIGEAQTDYMVGMMLSPEALTRDMRDWDYRFWIIEDDGRVVGFTGGATEELTGDPAHDAHITHSEVVNARWPKRWFISKVYLYAHERGKHYASRVIDFYERMCTDEGLPAMYLTVNRNNVLGVRAYLGNGFEIVDEVDADIGEGFVMTDHIMAKEVAL
ncbi:MAG: GNAT family N-acetyltransferase [Atopobiaceae bacterium]|nr:GNAT family N-acetyltransferase [Atopobiaceae bacterium]